MIGKNAVAWLLNYNSQIIKQLDVNIVNDWSYNASDISDNYAMQCYANLHSD